MPINFYIFDKNLMMEYAIISGDIIASTSLSDSGKQLIEESIRKLLQELKANFNVYGRIIKGDYLECYVPEISQVLRVALAIKSFIKSVQIDDIKNGIADKKRAKLFKIHGIRLAIGIGSLNRLDLENGIIDGDAIYYSGRIINEIKTSNKQKITIKNTLFLKSDNSDFNFQMEAILNLVDVLITKGTSKQCLVLYYKLMGLEEKQIVEKLGLKQSTINQHSTSIGWQAIEKAVDFFEHIMLKRNIQ
jgi:hypothetical protein